MISKKLAIVLTIASMASFGSTVFSREGPAVIDTNAPIVKVRVIALSSAVFTRSPVTEQQLNESNCRYETELSDKINELKILLSETVHLDTSNSFEPTNLRTAIYLYHSDGSTHRYLFNAESTKERIHGSLEKASNSISVNTDPRLITRLKKWAGPDTPWQKFSDTCL